MAMQTFLERCGNAVRGAFKPVAVLVRPKSAEIYQFRPGVNSGLGIGVEGLGLHKPQSDPVSGPYDPRNTVRGDFGPLAGGHVKTFQQGPQVSLKGGGSGLTGTFALQQLAEFQAGSGK